MAKKNKAQPIVDLSTNAPALTIEHEPMPGDEAGADEASVEAGADEGPGELGADTDLSLPSSDDGAAEYIIRLGSLHSIEAARVWANQAMRKIRAEVSIVHATTGEVVASFSPKAGSTGSARIPGDPRDKWASETGQAMLLMLRPEGATMDECKDVTGWSFGWAHMRKMERSFDTIIVEQAATSRQKKTYFAVRESDVAEEAAACAAHYADKQEVLDGYFADMQEPEVLPLAAE